MRLIDADAFERAVMFSDDADLQDVIYRLRDFPTADPMPWIPCTERLPETERHAFYLISSKGTSWIAKWNGEYWASIFFPFVEMEDVDAWAPMPEPWKGEQQ